MNQLKIVAPSVETIIQPDWAAQQEITLTVKRDDLLHPVISGNKWRKLKHALLPAIEANTKHIISFGGGFSNHLHALGYCCHTLNIRFTAIIRGDYSQNPSPMLLDLISWNTDILYVDRKTYQQRAEPNYLKLLQHQYPDALVIPEGGSQLQALQGVEEIIQELQSQYDYILAPVASGGTLAGLIQGATKDLKQHNCQVLGIGVLKGEGYLEQLVKDLLRNDTDTNNWQINHNYHFGGYAKSNYELTQFCHDFYQQTEIEIEPVYSGKLFFALQDLINKGFFPKKSRILALHTGGLQGAR
ncbi:pyridoxal-phosphate dependent enzyme [uncultured Paraglaciecola sp.]|uniref:1-aminocyclopropane-1-carboxylate deaminase/D-cysteine desulfhydrase n=1 Tax=uncultured Paraglaciecola sp. TaxID=1765024 RepID=UPI0025ED7E5A|nr:pyridoxal-phosphate dependent enzyme [uncultured Paraglaciecola sp.]